MPPGKEGKITLAVEHTESYSGEVSKSAQVITNDPKQQAFHLVLRAHFKSDQKIGAPPSPLALAGAGKQMGPFSISPSDRWLTSTLAGTTSAVTMYLYNNSATPIRIKQLVPGGTDFHASIQPIAEGKRYEISVATDPQLKPGQYQQTLRLLTDNKAAPELTIELAATVFPRIFTTPSSILLPPFPATVDISSINLPAIYVRKLRDGGLKLTGISSSLPFLKLHVTTETEGQVYSIKLVFDQSKITKGEHKGDITIETNDSELPSIKVPIQVSFS